MLKFWQLFKLPAFDIKNTTQKTEFWLSVLGTPIVKCVAKFPYTVQHRMPYCFKVVNFLVYDDFNTLHMYVTWICYNTRMFKNIKYFCSIQDLFSPTLENYCGDGRHLAAPTPTSSTTLSPLISCIDVALDSTSLHLVWKLILEILARVLSVREVSREYRNHMTWSSPILSLSLSSYSKWGLEDNCPSCLTFSVVERQKTDTFQYQIFDWLFLGVQLPSRSSTTECMNIL